MRTTGNQQWKHNIVLDSKMNASRYITRLLFSQREEEMNTKATNNIAA